jgi:hypothetical protein
LLAEYPVECRGGHAIEARGLVHETPPLGAPWWEQRETASEIQ